MSEGSIPFNLCAVCSGRGRVLTERKFDGGIRIKFEDCECVEKAKVARSSRQSPRFSVRSINRQCELDYREDLSRFPNDPQALVSGPRDLKRLIDQRKREGWRVGERTLEDVANTKPPEFKSSEQIAGEAYEAAKATGFQPNS